MLAQTPKPLCSFSNLICLYCRYRSTFLINFTVSGVFIDYFMDGLTHRDTVTGADLIILSAQLIICSDIAALLALSLQNCCQKHQPQLQYLQIDPSAQRKCGQDLQVPMLKNCVLTPWQITILPQ